MIILAAFILDIVLGDPEKLPHPVVLMGKWIAWLYRKLLSVPKRHQKILGIVAAMFNAAAMALATTWVLNRVPPFLSTALSIYIIYTSLALKTLYKEAKKVKKQLKVSIFQARGQLSRIVGRETDRLSEEEIVQATVETVSENTSDGVIAPLLYAILFGPAGAFCYKMINTMDSMVGYDDETYGEVGYGAAKLDDIANYIPARLTTFLFCMTSKNRRRTFRAIKRYHGAHLSPNAGWPEAAAAGILGIQLGGGHYYFGRWVEKPVIGEALKSPEPRDIDAICTAMVRASIACLLIYEWFHYFGWI